MDITHGTSSAYSYHRCRCEVCVAAKKQRDRDYYLRNAAARSEKARQYYAENKEVVSKRAKEYRERNAEALKEQKRRYHQENRDKIVAKVRKWREENPDRRKEQSARYREKHRAELNAKALAWYYKQMQENPELVRSKRRAWVKTQKGILANRAARTKRRGAAYTEEALEWIASLVDPLCAYCGRMATEIDHIVPISRNGTGEKSNLVPACRSCNSKKGNLTFQEFIEKQV